MISGFKNRIASSVRSFGVIGNENVIGENARHIWIQGDENAVAGDSSGVTVIGDGNKVTGSNVALINTYNKVINQSNSTYINGRAVSGESSIALVTSNKTVGTSGDDDATTYLCDATSGNITINLPSASDYNNAPPITFKKIDASANTVTIDGDGSETIDGATTKVLSAQYNSITIISDGENWWIVYSTIK